MEKVRQIIKEVLTEAGQPAVLWSGGKDSMLLLALAREVRPDIPCIWFRPGTHEAFARRMIMEWNLDVWAWEPSDVYLLPNSDGLSLVREQAFGESRLPVVLDIEDGERCIADVLTERTPRLFPHFDALLMGYKDSDSHPALGSGFCPPDGWRLGKAQVFAPLRDMTDEDVWKAIRELDVPFDDERYTNGGPDPDEIRACTNCLREGEGEVFCRKVQAMVPRVAWEPQERLKEFRQRFGMKEAA